jgi:predicted glycosyltransferase
VKILVDIGHPAHVHFFKNTIWALESKGHEVRVTARDKEVCVALLNSYNIPHTVLTKMGSGKLSLMKEWLIRDYKLLMLARKFKPDILIGILNPSVAHVSRLLGKKAIIFNDTEHATFAQNITYPFADVICTPTCFNKDIGNKQIRYNGYHELAYVHPNYFTPNPAVLNELGLNEGDIFMILRFVSWNASHDGGHSGIQSKIKLVQKLEKYGRVLITSEGQLDKKLEKNKIKVSPEKLHDLLYYATLYIGEGATTASECAILGTHAIYTNTLRLGYTDEEEEKYDLVYNFSDKNTMEKQAFEKALELLENKDLRIEGKKKRERLLKDKIDVTAFMIKFIENYPDSYKNDLKSSR